MTDLPTDRRDRSEPEPQNISVRTTEAQAVRDSLAHPRGAVVFTSIEERVLAATGWNPRSPFPEDRLVQLALLYGPGFHATTLVVKLLLEHNFVIVAVKHVRNAHNLDIPAAKKAVDVIQAGDDPFAPHGDKTVENLMVMLLEVGNVTFIKHGDGFYALCNGFLTAVPTNVLTMHAALASLVEKVLP